MIYTHDRRQYYSLHLTDCVINTYLWWRNCNTMGFIKDEYLTLFSTNFTPVSSAPLSNYVLLLPILPRS